MLDTSNDSPKSANNQNKSFNKANYLNFWRWLIYLMLLSLGGGISYGWYFLTQKMIPMIEEPVSKYLSRPIKLGEIEAISFNSIRIGESHLPKTNTNNNYAIVQAVVVKINPFKLFQKEVELDITIDSAKGYLQQDENNQWFTLSLNNNTPQGGKWRVAVSEIAVKNSKFNLQTNPSQVNQNPPVTKVTIPHASITLNDPEQYLFNFTGNLTDGAEIKGNGSYKPPEERWLLKLDKQNLPINTVNQIINLPVNLDSGKVNGELALSFWKGQLDLNSLDGEMKFTGVNLFIDQLPQTLTDSEGKIKFKNSNIILEDVNTNFGMIKAQAEGIIRNYQELDIKANIDNSIAIDNLFESLKLDTGNLEKQGNVKGKINITGNINQPLVKADIVNDKQIKIQKISFNQLSTKLAIQNSQVTLEKLEALPAIGGKINARGQINLDRQNSKFNIKWQAEKIPTEKLASLYQQKLPIKVGMLDGNYNLIGDWKRIDQTKLTGSSNLDLISGKATINQLEIDKNQWQGKVNLSSFKLSDIPKLDCNKIGCQESILNGNFRVSGKTNNFQTDNLNLAGRFDFDLAKGKVVLENTLVDGDNWQAFVKIENLDVSKIPSVNLSSSPVKQDIKLTANLKAKGKLSEIENIDIQGQGRVNLLQSEIKISNFTLQEDEFETTTIAQAFPLQSLNKNLRGHATGKLTVAGNLNYLQAKFIRLDGNLTLSEGVSLIEQPLDVSFQWDGDNIKVRKAVIDQGIIAKGIINYDLDSNNVSGINLDVTAQKVDIQKLPLPQSLALLNYQGKVDFQGKLDGDIVSPLLSGKVAVNNLKLANLSFSPLKGNLIASKNQGVKLDLNASGSQDQLSLQLNHNYQPQNIYVQAQNTIIRGKKEEQIFAINAQNIPVDKVSSPWLTYLPKSVKRLDGNLSGDIKLDATNYSLQTVNFIINKPQLNSLQGDSLVAKLTYNSGKFIFNQSSLIYQNNKYHFTGELQPFTDNPQLVAKLEIEEGNIQNLLTGLQLFEFSDIPKGFNPREYSTAKDLYASVNNSQTDNKIANNDSGNEESEPSTNFLTRSQKGDIPLSKKLLNVNQSNQLTDSTSLASSLKINSQSTDTNKPLVSISTKDESLLNTLTFFEGIEKEINQQEDRRTNATFPTLEELNGNFSGIFNVKASLNEGIQAEFDLQGDSWQWGKYEGNLLKVAGSYNNGLLTFLPVTIQDNESFLSITGTFQPERISGEVTLSELPLTHLKTFLNVPDTFDIEGNINATVAISGSQEKPLAKGNIEVVDSQINGNKIEKTQASFGFRNSRINFLATSKLNEDEDYFTIIASVPFRLFPSSIEPENNEFELDFNLTQKGFSLLSVVTDNQLNWVQGNGNINLEIKGKYAQDRNEVTDIQTQGIANLSDGMITGKILNEGAVTNINGQVLFDFARVNVPELKGNFSGGQISVSGSLPLVDSTIDNQSLNILVDDLALNLDNLYQGNLQGILDIYGTAIAPKIAGEIKLDNGDINIGKNNNKQDKKVANNNNFSKIKLNDLTVKLGENIHIIQPVLLKFRAEGDLNINGDLNNLSPEGIVKLKSGTVNFFTNQLKLVENRDNIARFTPQNGFNPYLDLQLETSVTQTSRYQLPDNSNPNEIQDITDFSVGTAQTIKVKANVQGWANDFSTNNIELSSSPSRGQTEIIALLGGGFVNDFAGSNSELNLVNFASAAVLGSVQGQIQQAFGFDELRFFPAQVLDTEERISRFGIGAELGIDLTNNFSFSVMKILTNEQAPRYNVRYRLNEQLILRGSTDFNKDSRSVLEFQKRF